MVNKKTYKLDNAKKFSNDEDIAFDSDQSGGGIKKVSFMKNGGGPQLSEGGGGDATKLSKIEGKLPQVYGENVQTPSTPGGDDTRSLIKSTKSDESNMSDRPSTAPKDKYFIVYIIFLVHGISTLMPWNMFITAEKYFVDYKLGGPKAEYAKNFLSYLGICAQVPNLLLNLVNAFVQTKGTGSLGLRIISSLCILILVLLSTIILAMIDSSTWPGVFFGVTMITAIVCNCAVGVYQNCIYGLAASFPMKYTGSVVLGSNISGTLTSIINLISTAVTPNPRMSAIYYFTTALFVVLLSFDSYFLLPHCKFFRHYHSLHRSGDSNDNVAIGGGFKAYISPYVTVFKKVWIQMWNIFFVFFVTLTVFPAMQVWIDPVDDQFFLAGKYFTGVTCFLFFNFFAMVGNIVPTWVHFPGPRWVWIPILLRGLLIPYFMFCNYRWRCRTFPVYIKSDWAYMLMGIFLGFTSGYFSSLVMMYTPRLVDKAHARIAAMLATFFLILGIVVGINHTLLVAYIVENVGPMKPLNSTC